jgi:hypothetical protein
LHLPLDVRPARAFDEAAILAGADLESTDRERLLDRDRRTGPSSGWRSGSSTGEPIMKLPAGMRTIGGQLAQSAKTRVSFPTADAASGID